MNKLFRTIAVLLIAATASLSATAMSLEQKRRLGAVALGAGGMWLYNRMSTPEPQPQYMPQQASPVVNNYMPPAQQYQQPQYAPQYAQPQYMPQQYGQPQYMPQPVQPVVLNVNTPDPGNGRFAHPAAGGLTNNCTREPLYDRSGFTVGSQTICR